MIVERVAKTKSDSIHIQSGLKTGNPEDHLIKRCAIFAFITEYVLGKNCAVQQGTVVVDVDGFDEPRSAPPQIRKIEQLLTWLNLLGHPDSDL